MRAARKAAGVVATFKRVDTCAAEFEAATPYMYSSYDGNDECASTNDRKVGLCPCRLSRHVHHLVVTAGTCQLETSWQLRPYLASLRGRPASPICKWHNIPRLMMSIDVS